MILRYAARNLARHRIRTALTTVAVVLAVGLIIVANALLDGMNTHVFQQFTVQTGHVRVQHEAYERESRFGALDYTVDKRRERQAAMEAVAGVTRVQARIRFGAMLQSTDLSTIIHDPDVDEETLTDEQIFGRKVIEMGPAVAIQPSREREGLESRLVQGSYFSSDAAPEVLIGVELAKRLGVKPGDSIELLTQRHGLADMSAQVVGVFDFGHRMTNRAVYVPLERAEELLEMADHATELLVFGEDYKQSAELLAALEKSGQVEGLAATRWQEIGMMRSVSKLFDGLLGLLLFAILMVAGAGLLNTMLMSVLERQREIGVLLALGMSRAKIVTAIVSEAVLFALIGSALGVLLGVAGAWPLVQTGLELGADATAAMPVPVSETIHADLTVIAVVRAALIGVFVAIGGALGPALSATRVSPVAAMRK